MMKTRFKTWVKRFLRREDRTLHLAGHRLAGTTYQDRPLQTAWRSTEYSAELRESGVDWHRTLYLDLMVRCLTGTIYQDRPLQTAWWSSKEYSAELRENGLDWPSYAHSMIGVKRLNNLRTLAELVIGQDVPGDFIETGVWRGGACILMRAVLQAHGLKNRRVWVADSFAGLPPPDPASYPADKGDRFHEYAELAVSLDEVKQNFARYDLLDEQVIFLQGWFKDTLPSAPINQLAILRLDGDMYESTMDALSALYDKVSPGGYVIVDDYHVVAGCKKAIHDFLSSRNLAPDIREIDGVGVYWQVADER